MVVVEICVSIDTNYSQPPERQCNAEIWIKHRQYFSISSLSRSNGRMTRLCWRIFIIIIILGLIIKEVDKREKLATNCSLVATLQTLSHRSLHWLHWLSASISKHCIISNFTAVLPIIISDVTAGIWLAGNPPTRSELVEGGGRISQPTDEKKPIYADFCFWQYFDAQHIWWSVSLQSQLAPPTVLNLINLASRSFIKKITVSTTLNSLL